MSKKFNPAHKLTLPKPPDGHYWYVGENSFVGPVMQLYKRRKRWFDSRVEERFPPEKYSDDSKVPLDRGLEIAAERIMKYLSERAEYRVEHNALWDSKIYLDDLISV